MTKTKMLRAILLVSLFCAATTFAQTPPADSKTVSPATTETKAISLGYLDGVNYVNDSFGLSLSIPREWVVISAQTRPEFKDDVKKLVSSADDSKKNQVNASIDRSTLLLSLTKLQAGAPNNAGLMLIAERIPTPAIKTGEDVLRSMKAAMTGTNFNLEFQGDTRTEQIGGASFAIVTIKNSSQLGVFMQKIYVTVKDGYALQLFFTYTDAADLPTFEAVVRTIKVK